MFLTRAKKNAGLILCNIINKKLEKKQPYIDALDGRWVIVRTRYTIPET